MKLRPEILALSVVCGCAGWQRYDLPADTALAPSQHVQVWRGSQARVYHGVRVSEDSLVGVPFQLPTSCDSCRIAMPRRQVDSLRLGDPVGAAVVTWGVPIVIFAVIWSYLKHGNDP